MSNDWRSLPLLGNVTSAHFLAYLGLIDTKLVNYNNFLFVYLTLRDITAPDMRERGRSLSCLFIPKRMHEGVKQFSFVFLSGSDEGVRTRLTNLVVNLCSPCLQEV